MKARLPAEGDDGPMTSRFDYRLNPPDEASAPRRRVTIDELRARRDEIEQIAARHGVTQVRVFGSVARGEADSSSDLDLLVDVSPGHSLWDLTDFALDVEEMLGVFTQVATVKGLKERIRERVLAEAVVL